MVNLDRLKEIQVERDNEGMRIKSKIEKWVSENSDVIFESGLTVIDTYSRPFAGADWFYIIFGGKICPEKCIVDEKRLFFTGSASSDSDKLRTYFFQCEAGHLYNIRCGEKALPKKDEVKEHGLL